MLPKSELIKTKEYWIEIISNEIWRQSKVPDFTDQCDAIAATIVTDSFMEQISFLTSPQVHHELELDFVRANGGIEQEGDFQNLKMTKRLFGMMPANAVQMEKTFIDELGLAIIIQAGASGWTILYADGSSEYKDVPDTAENNFNKAYLKLKSKFNNIKEQTYV